MKCLGRIFLGHEGPSRRDIPDSGPGMSRTKTLCKAPFGVVLGTEWPGCPGIWVGTSRDLGAQLGHIERLNARKFGSGVAPANRAEESEVRELSGKESGTSSGSKSGFRN